MDDAESPVSVNVLVSSTVLEPKAIIAGLKEQAPDAQERAMVSVKVPAAVMDIVKEVVVVPTVRVCVRVGELRLKIGLPVPVKVILRGRLPRCQIRRDLRFGSLCWWG